MILSVYKEAKTLLAEVVCVDTGPMARLRYHINVTEESRKSMMDGK
jgi:hypothetical protein